MYVGRKGVVLPMNENKGADQLLGNRAADLRLCFCISKSRFSHDAALLMLYPDSQHDDLHKWSRIR